MDEVPFHRPAKSDFRWEGVERRPYKEDDQALFKFHGMYQQDDRDRREERAQKKLERLYSFMIRLRLTGGVLSPEQWIALHHIAGENTTGVIKITTRQICSPDTSLKQHITADKEVLLFTIKTNMPR